MRRFRSLLIDQAKIRIPGLSITTVALHRHLPELVSVERHRHAWSQSILYLSGRGKQAMGGQEVQIGPGTLVVLPPGVPHAFQRTTGPAPVCLMVNFRLHGARGQRAVACSLNRSELAQVRQLLAQLMNLPTGAGGALHWESALAVLQVLVTLLRAAGWLPRRSTTAVDGNGRAIRGLLARADWTGSLAQIVQRSGYQRDHLNRLVKRETGLTLGQHRTQQRLAQARNLLSQGMRVSWVATAIGLPDQSYFARWFRRETGQSPTDWTRQKTVR